VVLFKTLKVMKAHLFLKLVLPTFVLLLLSSCASVHYFNVDVLKPAKVSLPTDIQNVVLINHSYAQNHCSVADFQGNLNMKFDSTFSISHVLALEEFLENSPRLRVLRVYNAPASYNRNFNLKLADSICQQTGADGAIILDHVFISKYGNSDSGKGEAKHYSVSEKQVNSIVSKAVWKLYDLKSNSIVDSQIIKDSINIISSKWGREGDRDQMPSFWDMLYNSANQSGNEYGKRIAQEWSSEQRYIYDFPESEFNQATKLVEKKNWDEAMKIWLKYSNSKNKRLSSIAAFNMAVGYEANDQLSEALEWASKSYFLRNQKSTSIYIENLELRLKNKYKIMRQMNGGKELVFDDSIIDDKRTKSKEQ
jgi:hypothetical protein